MSKIKLDAIDMRILGAVEEHGRMSKTALAEKVNLSATPCWTRLTPVSYTHLTLPTNREV